MAALLLAGTLLDNATDPWLRAFRQADAPQVRVDTGPPPTPGPAADDPAGNPPARDDPGLDDPALTALARLPGVLAVTAQQRTTDATLVGLDRAAPAGSAAAAVDQGTVHRIPLTVRADGPGAPRPLLTAGRWLDAGTADGLVLERSAAEAAWARPGDRLAVLGAHGQLVGLEVLGIADSPDQIAYPEAGFGLGWVRPATLDLIQPDRTAQGRTVGLRLADPATADYAAQRAVTAVGAGRVTRLATWSQARASRQQDDRLTGLLLGLCGLAALLAAALAVAGAAGGRIRARTGDIALLKALGFTRGQVVRMFTAQHLLLAGTGALIGWAGAILAVHLSRTLGTAPGTPHRLLPVAPSVTGAVAVATLAAIGLAAALPAHRASRVTPVPPADGTVPGDPAPRPARLGALRRLPPALVLGLSSAVRDRGPSAVTVLRLAVPVAVCTLAMSTWATLDAVAQHSGGVTPAALTVRPATADDARHHEELRRLLAADPATAGVYPGAELQTLAPGQAATLTLRALGTTAAPYPFHVVEGRAVRGPGEAVAGQGALDLLDVRIGQWVRVTTGDTPRILHVVGRVLEPDQGGRVISTSLDTLDRPGDPGGPAFYSVVLRPGADPATVQRELPARTGLGSRLDVRPAPDPAAQLTALRGAVIGLVALLGLIVLAEVLTAAATGLREHHHDLALLRAIGLTPRQAGAMMATRGTALALAATALGTAVGLPLSRWLIDRQGRAGGVGAGIAHGASPSAIIAVAVVTAATAAAVATLPALRAARLPNGGILREG
ncbi:FtsX-like permease family protein [Kitasatospora sp. NBC_00374]|uniref:FtsX-like permease family protein n=1 Tax=Kitasatospora sp. NBC_00374 TaxID=2975964 RepID=UPI0030E4D25E